MGRKGPAALKHRGYRSILVAKIASARACRCYPYRFEVPVSTAEVGLTEVNSAEPSFGFHTIVGASPLLRDAIKLATRVARRVARLCC